MIKCHEYIIINSLSQNSNKHRELIFDCPKPSIMCLLLRDNLCMYTTNGFFDATIHAIVTNLEACIHINYQ